MDNKGILLLLLLIMPIPLQSQTFLRGLLYHGCHFTDPLIMFISVRGSVKETGAHYGYLEYDDMSNLVLSLVIKVTDDMTG